jgi:hypothetical protein
MNVGVGADRAVLPVNHLSGIDVGLRPEDLRNLVSEDLRHKGFLMSAGSAGPTVQVSVPVDEVSKSHGLTTRMRDKLELLLYEIEDCAELSLSFLVEHRGSRGMRDCLSGLS